MARITVEARAFARYDEDLASWIWPGGVSTLHVGRSSQDLLLSARVRSGITRADAIHPRVTRSEAASD